MQIGSQHTTLYYSVSHAALSYQIAALAEAAHTCRMPTSLVPHWENKDGAISLRCTVDQNRKVNARIG